MCADGGNLDNYLRILPIRSKTECYDPCLYIKGGIPQIGILSLKIDLTLFLHVCVFEIILDMISITS